MVVVPAFTPVSNPVLAPIVATEVWLLSQVPPVVKSLKVVVLPWQTADAPVMGVRVFTVSIAVATHPAAVV